MALGYVLLEKFYMKVTFDCKLCLPGADGLHLNTRLQALKLSTHAHRLSSWLLGLCFRVLGF